MQRGQHTEMGTCPLCDEAINTAQLTAWRLVEDKPSRVHRKCLPEGVAQRSSVG